LNIHHGYYKRILPKLGYKNIDVNDITPNITPMLNWFYKLSLIPYQIIKLLGLQERYVNTTMAHFGKKFAQKGWWRFVIISASKKN
ncbi:MAG: hypothetical protein R3251_04660, partial [Candidatus Spechtbacterales bacterium]|nr:hypothetical protein [Candidatus Spechtbacterales bacterium]